MPQRAGMGGILASERVVGLSRLSDGPDVIVFQGVNDAFSVTSRA